MQSTLIIQNGDAVFAPGESTWTLSGKIGKDAIELTRARPSFDHTRYETSLKAVLTDDRVIGTYTTPTCAYDVQLSRLD